jgi:molybdopterin/thiamine biosynthesis adenylyltransferase
MNIQSTTAGHPPPDRYCRHRLIDGFDQDRLAGVDVIVIGAGAVGNEVLKNLALLGVGRIEIHDFDLIEIHNLTRSILFHEGLIGRPKAEAAAEACSRIDPNVSARGYAGDFRDRLGVERVRAADAVLCCVDNHEARIHLNRLCLLAGTPLLNAAIDAWEVSTEIYPHCGADAAACYECWIPAAVYAVISQRYSCGGLRKASIEQRRIPTTTLTSSIAGASLVSLLLQQVCGLPSRRRGSIQSRSRLLALTAEERSIAKNPDCPACGTYAGALALLPCAATAAPNTSAFTTAGDEEPLLILSEPIITGWSCPGCGSFDSMLARARDHDTSLTWCPQCGTSSRTVSIIAESTPSRLAELAAGRPLPVRFLYCPSSNPPVILSLSANDAPLAPAS